MRKILVLLPVLAQFLVATPDNASDWGCEVLLCAASNNPSWQAVPSCRPPMERLISEMSRPGFSWPTCPEGGSGKPGYDRYENCPAGWTPSTGLNDSGPRGVGSDLSQCTRRVDLCASGRGLRGNSKMKQLAYRAYSTTEIDAPRRTIQPASYARCHISSTFDARTERRSNGIILASGTDVRLRQRLLGRNARMRSTTARSRSIGNPSAACITLIAMKCSIFATASWASAG